MAEADDPSRRRGNTVGTSNQESVTRPANFGSVGESRFNTNRATGFRGGNQGAGGNISFEGGDALRGVRTRRTNDANVAAAQVRHDNLVAQENERQRQQAIEDAKPNNTEKFIADMGEGAEVIGHKIGDEVLNPILKPIGTAADNLKRGAENIGGEIESGAKNIGSSIESGAKNIGSSIGSGARSAGRAIAKPVGTVICTELRRQGLLSNRLWRYSGLHAENLPGCVMHGYRAWGIPYVRLMRKSPLATFLVRDMIRWRCEEVGYQIGKRSRGSFKGKIVRLFFEPFCMLVGLFFKDKDCNQLYCKES